MVPLEGELALLLPLVALELDLEPIQIAEGIEKSKRYQKQRIYRFLPSFPASAR